jgi:hypothetical protein
MAKARKHLISGLIILVLVGIMFYVHNLKKNYLPRYARLQLELYSVRENMEDIGQKDVAYSECVTEELSFLESWFHWNFNRVIGELEEKIDYCKNRLGELKKKQFSSYENQQHGFRIQYPSTWERPILKEGEFKAGEPWEHLANWKLELGKISEKGPCEGSECSQYQLYGYSVLDYNNVLTSVLENDEVRDIEFDKEISGHRAIFFVESGSSNNEVALLFGPNQTLKFINIWGDSDIFRQMIDSFNFQS